LRGQHYIDRIHAQTLRRLRDSAPSYTRQREQLARVRRASKDNGARDPVFDINGKANSQQWAEDLGVRTARILQLVDSIESVPWETLPERFVIKPDRGVSGNGVYLLRRSGDAFVDARSGARMTVSDLTSRLRRLSAAGTISTGLVVEEMVLDPANPDGPPVDWKVVTFFGRIGLIFGKRAQPGARAKTRWFDEDWNDVGRAAHGPAWRDPSIRPPKHAEEMLQLASRISACVPTPHLRVDLYEDATGPVFGEITPQPGGPVAYRRDVDVRLGAMWEEAQGRLMVRAARAGELTPATSRLPMSVTRRPGSEHELLTTD